MGTAQESGLAGTGPAADEAILEDEITPIEAGLLISSCHIPRSLLRGSSFCVHPVDVYFYV